jgi:hypothetical protein
MSRTIELKPPACNSKSVARSAWSILDEGLPEAISLSVTMPQRTQRSRLKSAPIAAADSGCKVFDTSTHAHTLPDWVMLAITESAKEVRPEHSGPTISVMAPSGKPPSSNLSTFGMPVVAIGRAIRGANVSAEGIRLARAASI